MANEVRPGRATNSLPDTRTQTLQSSGDLLDRAKHAQQFVLVVDRLSGQTAFMTRDEATKQPANRYGFVDVDSAGTPVNPSNQFVRVRNASGEFTLPESVARLMDPKRNGLYAIDDKGQLIMEPSGNKRMVYEPTVSVDSQDPRNQRVEDVLRPKPMNYSNAQNAQLTRALAGDAAMLGVNFLPVGELANILRLPAAMRGPLLNAALRTGAAAGTGAGVEAATNSVYGVPTTGGDMANAALWYGGGNLIGEGLSSLAEPAAELAMSRALRPTQPMLRENPELVQQALDARVRVRGSGAEATEARALKRATGAARRELLERGTQAGLAVDVDRVTERLNALRSELSLADDTGEAVAALDDYIETFRQRYGSSRPVSEVDARKRFAQRRAQQVFKAEKAGGSSSDVANITARARGAVAKDTREAIGEQLGAAGITGPNGETIHDLNRRYQQARQLEAAVERAQQLAPSRLQNTLAWTTGGGAGLALGHSGPEKVALGALAGGMMHYLNTPQVLSRAAILFSNPRFQQAVRYAPGMIAPMAAEATSSRQY